MTCDVLHIEERCLLVNHFDFKSYRKFLWGRQGKEQKVHQGISKYRRRGKPACANQYKNSISATQNDRANIFLWNFPRPLRRFLIESVFLNAWEDAFKLVPILLLVILDWSYRIFGILEAPILYSSDCFISNSLGTTAQSRIQLPFGRAAWDSISFLLVLSSTADVFSIDKNKIEKPVKLENVKST